VHFSTRQFGFRPDSIKYLALAAQIPAKQKSGCPRLLLAAGSWQLAAPGPGLWPAG
jgi:hypothetical protein